MPSDPTFRGDHQTGLDEAIVTRTSERGLLPVSGVLAALSATARDATETAGATISFVDAVPIDGHGGRGGCIRRRLIEGLPAA